MKNTKAPDTVEAQPVEAPLDPLSLAKPLESEAVNTAPIFGNGHQLVIDKSAPGRLSLHIPTNAEAFANLWSAPPTIGPDGKAKQATAKYLAKTAGNYGAATVDIDGRRCYVKLTVQVAG